MKLVVTLLTLLAASLAQAGNDTCERLLAARGMYTLSALPAGLEDCPGWSEIQGNLEAARAATVRIGWPGGGTGVMTDPNKLTTNWHAVVDYVPEASGGIIETGCWAKTKDEALPLEGIEVLVSTEPTAEEIAQTTAAVLSAAKPEMSFTEAGLARKKAIEKVEKDCETKNGKGWKCLVDERHPGREYALYTHRVYEKLALSYLPPIAVTYRDSDNFEHCESCGRLDQADLIVYNDDGTLANLPFVPMLDHDPKDGDRGFIVGTPGHTHWNRPASMVLPDTEFRRVMLEHESRVVALCQETAKQRPDLEGAVQKIQFGAENTIKVSKAEIADAPSILESRTRRETGLRYTLRQLDRSGKTMPEAAETARINSDPAVNAATNWAERYVNGNTYGKRFVSAWSLWRWSRVSQLPEKERPKGWVTAAEVRKKLSGPAQDIDLELITSGTTLELLAKYLPGVRQSLGEGNLHENIANTLRLTTLGNPEEAFALLECGTEAILASSDPLMAVAREVERIGWENRPLRARIEEGRNRSEQLIGLAVGGVSGLPNAAAHPRLILSEVRGHREEGKVVSPFSTLGALASRTDIGLPAWFVVGAKDDPTIVNMEVEAMSTGGVSGSGLFSLPNKTLVVTSFIFDGNNKQITSDSWQGGPEARAVVVTARGVQRFREIAGACEGPRCGERRLPPCRKP